MKHFLSCAFFLVMVCFPARAQWLLLNPPIPPYPQASVDCKLGYQAPRELLPYHKYRFVLSTQCYRSPSTGAVTRLFTSTDDLMSLAEKFKFDGSGPGGGFIFDITAYSDSSFSWFMSSGSGLYSHYYSSDCFVTQTASLSASFFPGGLLGSAITKNYVYVMKDNSNYVTMYRLNRANNSVFSDTIANFRPKYKTQKFTDDQTGYSLATYSAHTGWTALVRTRNFGNDWKPLLTDTSGDGIVDYSLVGATGIVAIKKSGVLYMSSDTGLTWTTKAVPVTGIYSAVGFHSSLVGYASAGTAVYSTTDGGTTWQTETVGITENVQRIYIFDDVAYVVGITNTVFEKNPTVGLVTIKDPTLYWKVYPNSSHDFFKVLAPPLQPSDNDDLTITVNDAVGREVYTCIIQAQEKEISAWDFAPGLYFVNVTRGNSQKVFRFIKTTN